MGDTIPKFLESMSRWLYRNPFKALISAFILLGVFVSQVPSVTVDTTSEALLHKDDPSLLEYNRFRDQFGRAELIYIAIESSEVFEESFIKRLKSVHTELEDEVPYLKEITSLINARHTDANEEDLIVEGLLVDWPERPVNLLELKQQVLKNPVYLNHIISADGRVTGVVVETIATSGEFLEEENILAEFTADTSDDQISPKPKQYFSEKENREVVEAVRRVVNRHDGDNFRITVSGAPIIIDAFNRATLRDVRLYVVLALLAVALFLWILFRRMSGLFLPMLIVNSSLFSIFGIMGFFGVPIKLTTSAIPAFVLVVGVCDAVHILAIFYRQFDLGETKEDALAYAFKHSGLAILLTSLTTMVGLLSFSFAELSAITDIGYFTAAGVMLALLYTIIMLPAFLALTPLKRTWMIDQKQNFKYIVSNQEHTKAC